MSQDANEWENHMAERGVVNKWEQFKMTCNLLGVDYRGVEEVLIKAVESFQALAEEKQARRAADQISVASIERS